MIRIASSQHLRGSTRLAALALVICTALALANLSANDLPLGWLLAFTVPAALLGRLPQPLHPWRRALLAATLQTTACLLAVHYSELLSRPAALACTILPPLAFVTARQQDADGALGLFLSFCVLLVGVILDGIHLPLVIGYGLAACLALRCEAHLAARTISRAASRGTPIESATGLPWSALLLAAPCLLVAFAVERTLDVLPSPTRRAQSAAKYTSGLDSARRTAGLSDSFVLDGGGVLAGLQGEQLVRVHTKTGTAVPTDLYLRSGFFAMPGLDRWQLGPIEQARARDTTTHHLRTPLSSTETAWLELERFAGARNFVFVPPGAVEIRGLADLVVDPAREWARQLEGSPLDIYEVGYQSPPPPTGEPALDARARRLGLLTLPGGLDRTPFTELLQRWRVGTTPMQAATAIAAGLAEHCRYDRIEPTGPYLHALQNFLFADGDRRGYCMHFASAAALLLRLQGIPCRIGVGLYGGDRDRTDPSARMFGSQHAHAWVEIPLADRGYVVFDPTPPAERGARMPSRADQSLGNQPVTKAPGAGAAEALVALFAFVTQPWLLALVLLIAIAATFWPVGPARGTAPVAPVPVRSARRLLARLLRALAEVGHPRRRGETLEGLLRALAAQKRLLPEVQAALLTYQEVRFGGRPFDSAREQVLQRGLQAAVQMTPLLAQTHADPSNDASR